VEDLPDEALRDPMVARSGGANRGRDGCRIPLPWAGDEPPYGFSDPGVEPWLPQPSDWAPLTVAGQDADPSSMLALYREALALRRSLAGPLSWSPAPAGVLAFRRDGGQCWVNLSDEPVRLPAGAEVRLASGSVLDGILGPDTAAWLS
jgi:alpha-glucosidase